MKNNQNIYLVGYRASGKTFVGKAVADKMNWSFVDADQVLERQQGRSIAKIVKSGGWKEFRELEKELLKQLIKSKKHVISTGGGVVLDPDNIKNMKNTGLVVWLEARPETICKRLANDEKTATQRPALTDQGVLGEITTVLEQRTPLYKDAADLIISTDKTDVEKICVQIISNFSGLPPARE